MQVFFTPSIGRKDEGEEMHFLSFHFCPLTLQKRDVAFAEERCCGNDDDRERVWVHNIIEGVACTLISSFFYKIQKSIFLKDLFK